MSQWLGVQTEEDRTQDRTQGDPSSETTRVGQGSYPGYPVDPICEVCYGQEEGGAW
jgi:hypothetical protein